MQQLRGRARSPGVLDNVTRSGSALDHLAQTFHRGIRRAKRIIRNLGLAKGMPGRVTKSSANAFLGAASAR